jgi:hypothetical protein
VKKYVIFSDCGKLKATEEENYNRAIIDGNKIINLREFPTAHEAARILKHYLHLTDDQIIII